MQAQAGHGRLQLQIGRCDTNTDENENGLSLLIDAFSAPQAEPLRVREFQTHLRTRFDEARALMCLELANSWRFGLWRRKKVN